MDETISHIKDLLSDLKMDLDINFSVEKFFVDSLNGGFLLRLSTLRHLSDFQEIKKYLIGISNLPHVKLTTAALFFDNSEVRQISNLEDIPDQLPYIPIPMGRLTWQCPIIFINLVFSFKS